MQTANFKGILFWTFFQLLHLLFCKIPDITKRKWGQPIEEPELQAFSGNQCLILEPLLVKYTKTLKKNVIKLLCTLFRKNQVESIWYEHLESCQTYILRMTPSIYLKSYLLLQKIGTCKNEQICIKNRHSHQQTTLFF